MHIKNLHTNKWLEIQVTSVSVGQAEAVTTLFLDFESFWKLISLCAVVCEQKLTWLIDDILPAQKRWQSKMKKYKNSVPHH